MGLRGVSLGAPAVAMFLVVGTAVAQRPRQQQSQQQTAQTAQSGRCRNLSFRGNYRLNGAQQYLARADQTPRDDDRRRAVDDAIRNLTEAATDRAADQLTLWYFFGRAYAFRRDYVGADSAWTRADRLADPECKEEITRRRRNEWVPLVNQAVELMNSQQPDSALAVFRRATVIFRGEPAVYTAMADIFVQRDNSDSAVVYFRLGAVAGSEPRQADARATAMLNASRLLHRMERFAAAESTYRAYLVMKPRDMAARTNLAAVLTRQNRQQEAAAIYDSLLANTDSLESFDLFETGVALFQQADALPRADTAQRAQKYRLAAHAFDLGLAKNPFHRDALFNLTNSFVAANDGPHSLSAARRLVAVDSLNRRAWTLLASSYQRIAALHRTRDSVLRSRRDSLPAADQARAQARAYGDSTVWALGRRDSLPLEVSVQRFAPGDSAAAIRGQVQNLQSRENSAFNLTLEFLNAAGEVLTRQVVAVPNLPAAGQTGSAFDFNLTATGRGILAYRYKVN